MHVNMNRMEDMAWRNLGLGRWLAAGLAVVVLVVAWWGVAQLDQGLQVRTALGHSAAAPPLRWLAPADAPAAPGVIIAHGFSGSSQIMLGYAYHLAHAGYAVLLVDFAGHAANPQPLDAASNSLQADLEAAYHALIGQPEVDATRIALVGHSMGSGAVMAAGLRHPQRYRAVVAISPTDAAVTSAEPPNLLLQAGTLEPQFVANAQALLTRAGGPNQDFTAGRARAFVEIPGVEHISILFSPASHQGVRAWLDQALEHSGPTPPADRRMVWYGLHLAGWLGLGLALAPLVRGAPPAGARHPSLRRQLLGLVVGSLAAVGGLALLARLFDITGLLGMLVGGAVGIWLLLLGSVWLLIARPATRPTWGALGRGLLLFALLWLAFGLLAQVTWLNWLLIPERLARWPALALACLAWKAAAGQAQSGLTAGGRLAWWLGQSVVVTAGLLAAAAFVPGLFFIVLVAPAIPLVLGLESIAAAIFDDAWAYALGGALFFGWLLATLFPLI